jgi:dihydroorotate dehydrogenase (NAD+) catalytic subunit
VTADPTSLRVEVAGVQFQNPIVLAAGTAGYGRELSEVIALDRLGALVTKAVSVEPRGGARPPRVAEFDGGMINAVGLANPGLDAVRREHLPWLATHVRAARVIVNVVGNSIDDFETVVGSLTGESVLAAFELNVSCPNVRSGGLEFGADLQVLRDLVSRVRRVSTKPLFVKLSPTSADIGAAARTAVDAGADAISVVNTLPGLVIDVQSRRPALGFGTGGVSGPALRPIGVLATWRVTRAVSVPVFGVGGVATADDALQYVLAGATLVGIGTAALRDPRTPERLVRELGRWCARYGVSDLGEIRGRLEWPT